MVVELSRVEVCVNYVLWCSGGSHHLGAHMGDLHGIAVGETPGLATWARRILETAPKVALARGWRQ
jgi:hypothetical protein